MPRDRASADDVGQLAHVDLDGPDERLLLRRQACHSQRVEVDAVAVEERAERLLDGPGVGVALEGGADLGGIQAPAG